MRSRTRLRESTGCVLLAAALILAAVTPVRAEATAAEAADQETVLREKANALMASSNWSEALPIWAKLYGLAGKPLDLWNSAICQYHLARAGHATPDQAQVLLEQYRDSPGVAEEKKAKAQRYIDEMVALRVQRAAVAPAAAVIVPAPSPSPAPRAEDEGRGLRTAAWIVGGTGVAVVLTGVYFGFRSHSLDNKVTNESTFSASDDSAGHLAETLQVVMYGVGAAAVATAGVLYYFGLHSGEPSSVALAPVAGPGRAGAMLRVRF